MVHAGMIGTLAETAAGAGSAWPAIAPLVACWARSSPDPPRPSNILFTDLQVSAASALGLPVPAMTSAQGFGAGIGNVVAPHNIIAGGAAVGLAGREGEILRGTAGPCLACALAGGSAVLGASRLPL